MKITAAVTHSSGADWAIEPVELADPSAREVRVRLVATGMCHTDLVILEHFPLPWPAVLGHEGAGVVDAVGADVTEVEVGDHVILCQPSCGVCRNCQSGRPSYCLNFVQLCFTSGVRPDGSCTHRQGDTKVFGQFLGQSSFASHAIVGVRCIVKVDADIPLELASPLSCGVQTGAGAVLNSLRPEAGSSFVVFGAGAVGLSALMAARIVGCLPRIAVDKVAGRLALAKELGATHVVDASTEDAVAEVHKITGGGADGAVETAGGAAVMLQAIAALAHCGTAVLTSTGPNQKFEVDQANLLMRGVTIKTSLLCAEGTSSQLFIPKLIAWWKAGMFPFDKMIRQYRFSDINQAKKDSLSGVTVKPVLILS
jgi:aryl-alcohol dehydrogenase